MTLSKVPRPHGLSKKSPGLEYQEPVLGTNQLNHGFEQQALYGLILAQ